MKGLADTLIRSGAVSEDAVRGVIAEVGEGAELQRRLVADSLVTPAQLAQGLAEQTGYAYVDLGIADLRAETIALVSATLCRRYQLIPVERGRRAITIGMVDPSDLIAIDDITTATCVTHGGQIRNQRVQEALQNLQTVVS